MSFLWPVFINNETFIEHMKMHNKEKPYNCRHCQKSFLNNIHLKRHMKRHNGEESYQCKHCDKTFLHMSALENTDSWMKLCIVPFIFF